MHQNLKGMSEDNTTQVSHSPALVYTARHAQLWLNPGLMTLRVKGNGQTLRDKAPPKARSGAWIALRSTQSSSVKQAAPSTATWPSHPDICNVARIDGWKSLSASSNLLAAVLILERMPRSHKKHIVFRQKSPVQESSGIDRREFQISWFYPTYSLRYEERTDDFAMSARHNVIHNERYGFRARIFSCLQGTCEVWYNRAHECGKVSWDTS